MSVYGGSNAFGTRPASVATPNPFSDLSSVYPNLSGANAGVSSAIASQLAGQLSPSTQAAIQDAGARFGVSSGMPGSGLVRNRTVRDLGITTEQQQQRGIDNYTKAIPVISGTQTVRPETQFAIQDRNSVYASAPDPMAAANHAEQLYSKYLGLARGGGGGGGGGPQLPGRGPSSPAAGFGGGGGVITSDPFGEAQQFRMNEYDRASRAALTASQNPNAPGLPIGYSYPSSYGGVTDQASLDWFDQNFGWDAGAGDYTPYGGVTDQASLDWYDANFGEDY